jgi:adenylyltransferase/sulfurtransferase
MLLPGIDGERGQRGLLESCALIVGCGALGTVIADSLCRAGVGRLIIVDRDVVEWTNLQRQTLFDEDDARTGAPKAAAAASRLAKINSSIVIEPIVAEFDAALAEELVPRANVVLDGLDSFSTRYVVNDACVKHGVPYVYGGAIGTRGTHAALVLSSRASGWRGPCLRCLFPTPPDDHTFGTCDTVGVLGPLAGTIALRQASSALRVLLGHDQVVIGRAMTEIDLWPDGTRRVEREIDIASARDPSCECCGLCQFTFLDAVSQREDVTILCGSRSADARDEGLTVQVLPRAARSRDRDLDLFALAKRLAPLGEASATTFTAKARIDPAHAPTRNGSSARELAKTVFRDGRAIIRGVCDPAHARIVYDRHIGS